MPPVVDSGVHFAARQAGATASAFKLGKLLLERLVEEKFHWALRLTGLEPLEDRTQAMKHDACVVAIEDLMGMVPYGVAEMIEAKSDVN